VDRIDPGAADFHHRTFAVFATYLSSFELISCPPQSNVPGIRFKYGGR
jgi:hypothetical protein